MECLLQALIRIQPSVAVIGIRTRISKMEGKRDCFCSCICYYLVGISCPIDLSILPCVCFLLSCNDFFFYLCLIFFSWIQLWILSLYLGRKIPWTYYSHVFFLPLKLSNHIFLSYLFCWLYVSLCFFSIDFFMIPFHYLFLLMLISFFLSRSLYLFLYLLLVSISFYICFFSLSI